VPAAGFALEILSASIEVDGSMHLKLRATDSRGQNIPAVEIDRVRAGMAAVVPSTDGSDGDQWNSFVLCAAERPNQATLQPCVEPIINNFAATANTIVNDDRTIDYTFTAVQPANDDATALHRAVIEGRRTFEGVVAVAEAHFDFAPNGGTVSTRELIVQQSCDGCHARLELHGGQRNEVANCVTCHTRQLIDPDTNRELSFDIMIHKIHRGELLPSVEAGEPYVIVGRGGEEHDFSEVVFPQAINNCVRCHEGSAPNAERHLSGASIAACASCHDRTWFNDLQTMPAEWTMHTGGAFPDSTLCQGCHSASGSFVSVRERHFLPWEQPGAPSLSIEITGVEAVATSSPAISFTLSDRSGNPIDDTANITRLSASFAGPQPDYATRVSRTVIGPGAAGVLQNLGAGAYRYTFNARLGASAAGTWAFSFEGYRQSTLPDGTTYRYAAVNPLAESDVTGGATVARKEIVDTESCNSCHLELTAHGNNRTGNADYCVTCHNPTLTDAARRPAGAGAPASVDFKVMIHRIHRGADLPSVVDGTPYVIYGFGSAAIDFSHVRFPGGADRCNACHLDDTTQNATAVACMSCHDSPASKAHAELNTTLGGVESCAVCHGPDREVSVEKAHAR
jgi:OmcA/MtrC family decaheme c-type cytochrome